MTVRTNESGAESPAAALERELGDPFDAGSAISFRRAMELDDQEESPTDAFLRLHRLGIYEWLIPKAEGGRLTSFVALSDIVRALSRRDLVVTVGLGSSLLAAVPIWLWGDPRQRGAVQGQIAAGEFGCLAVSEREAGSDIYATATRAEPEAGGLRLSGEKWLVGNARRSSFATVLAQSDPSLTLYLVVKDALDQSTFAHLPKVRTVGLRGHDLGGIEFKDCRIPRSAAVGTPGRGGEMLLMSLQITRTMIAGMAVGAADTALRIALRWGQQRRLYGDQILSIPPVGHLLLGSFVDLLICDCLVRSATRGLTVAPSRMSLWSAVVKYFVPLLCEEIVQAASVVLSARYYLREGVAEGMLQKIQRDLAIASIFEGTQLVQLSLIASQLSHKRGGATAAPGSYAVDPAELFPLSEPAPDWDPRSMRLRLSHVGPDEIVDGWQPGELGAAATRDEVRRDVITLGQVFAREREQIAEGFQQLRRREGTAVSRLPLEAFELARRYCVIHAAAACVQTWNINGGRASEAFSDGDWLVLCLERLRGMLSGGVARFAPPSSPAAAARVTKWMAELDATNSPFSVASGSPATGSLRGAPA